MKVKMIPAVMVHVPAQKGGIAWYEKAFPQTERISYPYFEFECPVLDGIQLEIVNIDEKVGIELNYI